MCPELQSHCVAAVTFIHIVHSICNPVLLLWIGGVEHVHLDTIGRSDASHDDARFFVFKAGAVGRGARSGSARRWCRLGVSLFGFAVLRQVRFNVGTVNC